MTQKLYTVVRVWNSEYERLPDRIWTYSDKDDADLHVDRLTVDAEIFEAWAGRPTCTYDVIEHDE